MEGFCEAEANTKINVIKRMCFMKIIRTQIQLPDLKATIYI